MDGDFQTFANVIGGALIFYFVFRAGSNRMRVLSKSYPEPDGLVAKTCGLYAYNKWWFLGGIRVSVNSEGLALSQIVLPFVWHIRAFVPWEDTFVSEDRNIIRIGAVQVPTFELVLNKVVLSTMQHCLKRKAPFGNIV